MVFRDPFCPVDCQLGGVSLALAFRLIRTRSHPEYQPENALFREMVGRFVLPAWAKRVIVEGDAA
jgi:hypothetical protein